MVAVHQGSVHQGPVNRGPARRAPVRKSVPLTDAQLDLLRRVREPSTPERQALEAVAGPLPDGSSDARVLSSLLDYAAQALAQARLDADYAAWAQTADADDAAHARAVRDRRHRLDD